MYLSDLIMYGQIILDEAIFYYRQKLLLYKKIIDPGLFQISKDFKVIIAVHDMFENEHKGLSDFVEETMSANLSDVLIKTGLLK